MTKEQLFNKKVKELVKKANNLEDAEVRKVVKHLADARKEIASAVASTGWQAYHLPKLKNAVERAMQQFAMKYGIDLRDAQLQFWGEGINMVDLPLSAVGITAAIPAIDSTVLGIMQGYGADLVSGLSASANRQIVNEMTMGLMGNKSPFEVMKAIGTNLKDKSIFRSIAERAEVITRTECGRVLEAATQARNEKAAHVVPGLQKQWIHGSAPRKMPRISHIAADGQTRDVNKPFDVGGEKLMYPKDPAGSAKNTIKCQCYSAPYHPDWQAAIDEVESRKYRAAI